MFGKVRNSWELFTESLHVLSPDNGEPGSCCPREAAQAEACGSSDGQV